MLIWRVLDGLLHHLLLMMSLDCPLAIRHKNGEYTLCMEIGGVFCFVLFWGTKIVFRSFFDVFLFIWLKMYLFLKVVHVRGRHYVLCFFYCFFSHVIHWLLIYIMTLFMVYVFYFLFCEIKNFLLFYLYFPHMRLCVG